MLNLDPVVNQFVVYLIQQPILIPSITAFVVGMLYFFGWIVNANTWQYQNSGRQSHIYRGFDFFFGLILPTFLIYGLVFVLENTFNVRIVAILNTIPSWIYPLVLFVFLMFLERLMGWTEKKIVNLENPVLAKLGVAVSKFGDFKYIYILSNLGFFLSSASSSSIMTAFVLFIDFVILLRWARLSNLDFLRGLSIISMNGSKQKITARIVEFVENGKFLKVQEKETKTVMFLPTSEIGRIETMAEKTDLNSFMSSYFSVSTDKRTKKKSS